MSARAPGDLFGRGLAEPGTQAHAEGERIAREARLYDEFAPRPGERDATIDEQIAEVEREIRLRRRFYPGWVRNGTLSDPAASRQLQAMLSVRRTLITLRSGAGGAP